MENELNQLRELLKNVKIGIVKEHEYSSHTKIFELFFNDGSSIEIESSGDLCRISNESVKRVLKLKKDAQARKLYDFIFDEQNQVNIFVLTDTIKDKIKGFDEFIKSDNSSYIMFNIATNKISEAETLLSNKKKNVSHIDINVIANILKLYVEELKMRTKNSNDSPEYERMYNYRNILSGFLNMIPIHINSIETLRTMLIENIQNSVKDDMILFGDTEEYFDFNLFANYELYALTFGILFDAWEYTDSNKEIKSNPAILEQPYKKEPSKAPGIDYSKYNPMQLQTALDAALDKKDFETAKKISPFLKENKKYVKGYADFLKENKRNK